MDMGATLSEMPYVIDYNLFLLRLAHTQNVFYILGFHHAPKVSF